MEKITRKEILKQALNEHKFHLGICGCLNRPISRMSGIRLSEVELREIFPKFRRFYAIRFGASLFGKYWWTSGKWKGRLKYLNWLNEQYKDDERDISKLLEKIENP